MDIRRRCLYCSKMYCYIGAHITHLRRDHTDRIVYVSAEQLPDDGFAIEHYSILVPFIREPHHDPFLHLSDDDSSDTEADSETACINLDQPPVRTRIYGTPHMDCHLPSKPISNQYFDIYDDGIDLGSPCSCEEDYRLAHWCIMHDLSRAAIPELFRNCTMATVSNFTLFHTLFKRLNEMSYTMGIDSWKPGNVCYNLLADPNKLRDDDYVHFIRKKHFRPGGMAPSEWTHSVRAVRDTPVADYSAPGANTTHRVAYRPPIAVSAFLLALSVSNCKWTLWCCGQLWPYVGMGSLGISAKCKSVRKSHAGFHKHKAFRLSYSSSLQSRDSLPHNMACII